MRIIIIIPRFPSLLFLIFCTIIALWMNGTEHCSLLFPPTMLITFSHISREQWAPLVEKHKDLRVSSFWTGSQSFLLILFSLPVPMLRLHCQNKKGTPLYPLRFFFWMDEAEFIRTRPGLYWQNKSPAVSHPNLNVYLKYWKTPSSAFFALNTLCEVVSISADTRLWILLHCNEEKSRMHTHTYAHFVHSLVRKRDFSSVK